MPNRLTNRSSRRSACLIILLLFVALLPVHPSRAQQQSHKPTVLLISLDGFRWDYLNKVPAPNLLKLAGRGIRAKSMIPVFPSETFPNHYSIVTGDYPEANGIVGNSFYDPALKESFRMSGPTANQTRWWGAEPIWITAEKQGQIAATYFWPGSDVEIEGKRPTFWKPYDGRVPNSDRVKEVLSWFALPEEKRPSLVTLYFSDTDHAGHQAGPDSPGIAPAVKEVDDRIGDLVKGLADQKMLEFTNIIVVSDHGMAAVPPEHQIFLEDYMDVSLLEMGLQSFGPAARLWPVQGKDEDVYKALLKAPHIKAYRKQDTPEYFHYRNNPRIAPIVAVADEGWEVSLKRVPPRDPQAAPRTTGSHGYDPKLPDMHAIFIAAGPAFKEGLVVEPFENIQVYNVMAYILKLKPAPNNGDLSLVKGMLK